MVVVYGIGLKKNIRIFKLELGNLQFRPSSHVVSMCFFCLVGLEQSPRCVLRAVVPLTSALRSLLLCRCLPWVFHEFGVPAFVAPHHVGHLQAQPQCMLQNVDQEHTWEGPDGT